jgi:hypothetical protein
VPLNAQVTWACWSPDGRWFAYQWKPIPRHLGRRVFRELTQEDLTVETEEFVTVSGLDGLNAREVATGKGSMVIEVILTGIDWR